MTREEAREYFEHHMRFYCVTGVCREAEEMAVEEFKKEPCEDAISRQAAEALFRNARGELHKSAIRNEQNGHPIKDLPTRDLMLLNAEQMIHLLPSVKPQEPNMTWVTGADGAKIAFKDVPVWKVTKICEILGEPQENCDTCKHKDDRWDSESCDGYCGNHSGFEPQESAKV